MLARLCRNKIRKAGNSLTQGFRVGVLLHCALKSQKANGCLTWIELTARYEPRRAGGFACNCHRNEPWICQVNVGNRGNRGLYIGAKSYQALLKRYTYLVLIAHSPYVLRYQIVNLEQHEAVDVHLETTKGNPPVCSNCTG